MNVFDINIYQTKKNQENSNFIWEFFEKVLHLSPKRKQIYSDESFLFYIFLLLLLL